jgi:S1-C subfamily serine protease
MGLRIRIRPLLATLLALAPASCGPSVTPSPVGRSRESGTSVTAFTGSKAADPIEAVEQILTEAIARVRESAVALEYSAAEGPSSSRRVASGVVVSDDGEVLSIRIDPPSSSTPIMARVASGRRLPARWVAADPETGLTLLRIERGSARPASPATHGARVGLPVLIVGNPFGLAHSVSHGFVAGLGRRLELGPRQLGGLIQIDAALHPGDSGALLGDLHGGWLGVIRSGLAPPGGESDDVSRASDHDLGFAIPATDALWVAGQLRTRGQVDRAYLGVTMDKTFGALAVPSTGPDGADGAVLGRVLADTPAERAGLKAGDRVIAIDGVPVRSPYDLTDRLDRTPADAEVTLDLVRAAAGNSHQIQRLTLRAARRPPFEPSRPSKVTRSKEKDGASRVSSSSVPRDVADTLRRLEHRVQELEKREAEEAPAHQR